MSDPKPPPKKRPAFLRVDECGAVILKKFHTINPPKKNLRKILAFWNPNKNEKKSKQ